MWHHKKAGGCFSQEQNSSPQLIFACLALLKIHPCLPAVCCFAFKVRKPVLQNRGHQKCLPKAIAGEGKWMEQGHTRDLGSNVGILSHT